MTARSNLVRYVSPFRAPAWMPAWQAEGHLEQEDRRWARLAELDMLSDAQCAVGPPHIEHEQSDNDRP
ncbi:MAG: hypothetical protein ACHQIG_05205 [Acidimicrobiia bacterium]